MFDELVPANTNPDVVEATVRELADARLITTDETAGKGTIYISHEKLIESWPWLRKLVDENREAIDLQNKIAADAREWADHSCDPSYLYKGARLAGARELLWANKVALNDLVQKFIEAGIKAREDEMDQLQRQTQIAISRQLAAESPVKRGK